MERVTVRMARSDRRTPWGFGVTEAPDRSVVIVNVSFSTLIDMLTRLAFAPPHAAQHSYLRKLRPLLSTSRILLLTADSNGYHRERMLHHPYFIMHLR